MPSLHAFGRRWNIASDDLVFPSLTDLFVRGAWVMTSIVLFVWHNPFGCKSYSWLPLVVFMLMLNIVSGGLSMALAILSAQGSILDTERRRHVTTLIYARVPIFLAEITWTVATTLVAFDIIYNASQMCQITMGIRIAVCLEWMLVLATIFGVLIVFNPIDGRRMERSMVHERLYWRKRLCLCKVRQNSRVREAIDDIAALMASFFADTDFVLSDIIAGLLLLVHSPNKRIPAPLESAEHKMDPDTCPAWIKLPDCLELATRYLAFSVAVYGWPHYVVTNCGCAAWCLLCRQTCCCCRKRVAIHDELTIIEDNCCSCHSGAFMLKLDADCRLCFLSFHNHLFEVPFAVLVDNKTGAIVIAIRGSASFMDLITDLSLSEDLLSSVDVDSDPILRCDKELDGMGEVRVHRGILRGARYVYETLMNQHILEDLQVQHPDHHIVVTGHSLGAGIASLLALLLKSKYSDVRCYAFAPPGSVISENGIRDTQKHTLSIVLGDDVIPRMTYQSIHLLKTEIEREIASTDKAKYEILIKGIFRLFIAYPFELHRNDSGNSNRSTRNLCLVEEGSSAKGEEGHSFDQKQQGIQSLRPPGHLLHLNCPDKEVVELRWIHHSALTEIQLTSSMLRDHLPMNMEKALRQAVSAYTNGNGAEAAPLPVTNEEDSDVQPIIS